MTIARTKPFFCEGCGKPSILPPQYAADDTRLCLRCYLDTDEGEPLTEQDRIDIAGDDLFHSMREDGEL